ncbi:hypothetical protein [Arthrobacter sp. TE12232]
MQISNEHLIRERARKAGGADVAVVTILTKFHPIANESVVKLLQNTVFA